MTAAMELIAHVAEEGGRLRVVGDRLKVEATTRAAQTGTPAEQGMSGDRADSESHAGRNEGKKTCNHQL